MKTTGTTITNSTWTRCDHLNGRFRTIRIWFLKRSYFICFDCGSVIEKRIYDITHQKKVKP